MIHSTKEIAINKLKKLNYKIVNEDEYLQNKKATTNYRTHIKCLTHDYIWDATIGDVYRNAKICKECRLEQDKTWKDYTKEKKYKIINENGIYITLQCEFNHSQWTARNYHIKSTNCKECSGTKITLQTILDKLDKLKFELLNIDEFKTTKTIGEFKCSRGHIWKTPFTIACNKCNTEFTSVWDNLKQRQVKNGCTNCNKIKEINEKLKKIEYEFVDLVYTDANIKHNYSCLNEHIVNKCWNTIKVQKSKCKECK
jgi:hypothetical protein